MVQTAFWYAALATRNVEFYQNRVFDPQAVRAMRPSLQPIALPWLEVHTRCRDLGVPLVTADQVFQSDLDPHQVLLVAYDWTPDAARLVSQGAHPAALVSFEPPVIGWELYYHLPRVSSHFPHTFLFGGAERRVHPFSQFHHLYFPQTWPPHRPIRQAWSNRRLLAMINSNKALARADDLPRWLDYPREVSAKRLVAGLRYRPILRDCYSMRLRAIEAFTSCDGFDLYGEGWEHRHPAVKPKEHAAALRAYRGTVADKYRMLANYRFALVIENSRFAGYVSEKLFDCFFAGCVPIYRGAPDVARFVPKTAFIDADEFPNWGALERYLYCMEQREWRSYVEAAEAFLLSPAFECFSATRFATDVADALMAVGEKAFGLTRVP
jgi:hypothetical protein